MPTKTKSDREDCVRALKKLLPKGKTVYTVIRSVAKSGMSRRMDAYVIVGGRLQYLSGYIAGVLDMSRHPSKQGLLVHGCGMDMGFHLVYELSSVLHKDGYALKQEWV